MSSFIRFWFPHREFRFDMNRLTIKRRRIEVVCSSHIFVDPTSIVLSAVSPGEANTPPHAIAPVELHFQTLGKEVVFFREDFCSFLAINNPVVCSPNLFFIFFVLRECYQIRGRYFIKYEFELQYRSSDECPNRPS